MSFSNMNCCVPQCTSRKSKNEDLTFHRFPAIIRIKKEWIRVLKIGKEVSPRMTVCSKHFQDMDFLLPGPNNKRRNLKRRVIPSKCLPVSSVNLITKDEQNRVAQAESRYMKISRKRQLDQQCENEWVQPDIQDSSENHDSVAMDGILPSTSRESEIEIANALLSLMDSVPNSFEDKAIQVQTSDILKPRLDVDGLSDKELNSYTGLPSNNLLNALTECVIEKLNYTSRRITVRQQIIVTMMRIKLNLKFVVLANFFRISPTTCKDIFSEMVCCLAKILQTAIHWPDKEEVMRNIPKCFFKLDGIRVVIDCTEIPVCKPKCLTCNLMLYSHYKGRSTIKYMASVSPGGTITNISFGYGGRASDKSIFEQSSLLHQLEPHIDKVLVDKGFLIDDACAKSYIEVKRPPFVKNGKLTEQEALQTRSIARARVHVERMIQRIKIFSMLNSQVPWELVPYFDYIMIIISGICNLQAPILSDERF